MTPIDEIQLADIYANAGLEVDADRFAGRQAAVTAAVESVDTAKLIDLAAIVFGLSAETTLNQLVNAVREDDASFSAKAHARELCILALGALEALTTGSAPRVAGMHAVLALSACGQRTCEVDSRLVTRMEGRRRAHAVQKANALPLATIRVGDIKLDGLDDKLTAFASTTPHGNQNTSDALRKVFEGLGTTINVNRNALAKAIQARLTAVNERFRQQQNELDLLWWLFGGWSSSLEAPFATFDPPARALLIGVDLGSLSDLDGSPAPVQTFVQRAMGQVSKQKHAASLQQIVGALELNDLDKFHMSEFDLSNVTAFPVLGTLARRLDRAVSADESSLYKKIETLNTADKTPVLQWAEHVYHEMVLARHLLEDADGND